MKIRIKDQTIFLADDSPIAKKIADGYDCRLNAEGKIEALDTKACLNNKYQLAAALKKATSLEDLKSILLKVIEVMDYFV